jgi:hypothetical protein
MSGDEIIESSLRRLAPTPARLDPITAAFAAGRRVQKRTTRLWQTVCVCLVLITAAIGRTTPRHADLATSPPLAVIQQVPMMPSEQSLLMLQRDIGEKGIDGLPEEALPPAQPASSANLF